MRRSPTGWRRLTGWLLTWPLWLCGLLVACSNVAAPNQTILEPVQITLEADGRSRTVISDAANVRQLLQEADVAIGDADLVEPRLTEPLVDGMVITVVRVTESIEVIPQSIPFARKIVRSDAMEENDPARILQAGRAGLQETRVRLVYHDGIEVRRIPIDVTIVEPAQDEIVMVGIGAARDDLTFAGVLAYISDGTAVLLRGSTLFPERIETGGALDGRVFALSPTGSHLLYTRTSTATTGFNNSLWVVSTDRGAAPRPLNVANVLWAGWNPARTELLQVAFTTAISTTLPPGWEANNDLWLGDVLRSETAGFEPEELIESYPATFGWWGGNYAWSPDGRRIAYAYANEVGVIDVAADEADRRRQLLRFTEYNTLADWVWVPSLSWSGDGRYLAFASHDSPDPERPEFASQVLDVDTGLMAPFVPQAGMWAHLHWSPAVAPADSRLAYLQATNALDSQRSSYTLWLMDRDGSNKRQIFPPPGENSRFPRQQQFMAWGPTGTEIAFVFNDALHLLRLDTGAAFRITQDDALSSHPTWAPYGAAVTETLPLTAIRAPATTPTPAQLLPPEP